MTGLYNRDVLRLAASLTADDSIGMPHGSAEARARTCGSHVSADVNLDKFGRIIQVAFRTRACAIVQASAAILQGHAAGENAQNITAIRSSIAACLNGEADMPGQWPDLSILCIARQYPARHAAVLLPYDALLLAITKAGA
jgi:NifU-like protein involved in Fe-S cluster formation